MKEGRPSKNGKTPSIEGVSQPKAAKLMKVSTVSVERAAKVKRVGGRNLTVTLAATGRWPRVIRQMRPKSESGDAAVDHGQHREPPAFWAGSRSHLLVAVKSRSVRV
jgi:hypothetical protein